MDADNITATSATSDASNSGQAKSPNHIEAVDALRGLAAVLVVLFHLIFVPVPNLEMSPIVRPMVVAGGSGVVLFFVVSAFTLCLSMASRREKKRPLASFYLRRLFRIVPLYYFLLVFSVLRDRYVFSMHHSRADILLAASFGYNFVPGKNEGIVNASWTLGVEMIFYLLFPLLFRLVNTLEKAVAFYLGALLAATGFQAIITHSSLPPPLQVSFFHLSFARSLPPFAAGIMAYFIFTRWIQHRPSNRNLALWLISVSLIAHVITGYTKWVLLEPDYYWHALIYGGLLTGLLLYPFPLFVNRVTKWYGKISYSLYLNHPICLWLLSSQFPKFYRHLPPTIAFVGCFALTLAVLTPLSYATYKFVEEPGIRWGSRVIRNLK